MTWKNLGCVVHSTKLPHMSENTKTQSTPKEPLHTQTPSTPKEPLQEMQHTENCSLCWQHKTYTWKPCCMFWDNFGAQWISNGPMLATRHVQVSVLWKVRWCHLNLHKESEKLEDSLRLAPALCIRHWWSFHPSCAKTCENFTCFCTCVVQKHVKISLVFAHGLWKTCENFTCFCTCFVQKHVKISPFFHKVCAKICENITCFCTGFVQNFGEIFTCFWWNFHLFWVKFSYVLGENFTWFGWKFHMIWVKFSQDLGEHFMCKKRKRSAKIEGYGANFRCFGEIFTQTHYFCTRFQSMWKFHPNHVKFSPKTCEASPQKLWKFHPKHVKFSPKTSESFTCFCTKYVQKHVIFSHIFAQTMCKTGDIFTCFCTNHVQNQVKISLVFAQTMCKNKWHFLLYRSRPDLDQIRRGQYTAQEYYAASWNMLPTEHSEHCITFLQDE